MQEENDMVKKNMMKVLSAAAVCAMVLSACGSSASETTTAATTAAAAEESTAEGGESEAAETEAAGETRTVIVGTVGNGEPYSLVDDAGNWTGIEADLWAEVAERTGWTVEMKQAGDLASVFGELESGRVDVAANCFAITEKRLESYLASDPIYGDAQVIIVQPDSSYETFEDLRGLKMGVTAGQAAQTTIEEMAPEYDWEVVTYEDTAAGFQDCALGRVDAYAHTVSQIKKAEQAQGLEFRMLDEKLFGNNVGWWFAPTDEGKELRDACNEVIAEMKEDGTLSEIVSKWMYGEDMTQLAGSEWLSADR